MGMKNAAIGNVNVERYDLNFIDFESLDIDSSAALLALSGRWQARNSAERIRRIVKETQGPQILT